MPEFILNTEGASNEYDSLDEFTQGFIEAAFFTSVSSYDSSDFFKRSIQKLLESGEIDGTIPQDSSVSNIDFDSFCSIKDFCDQFQSKNQALLDLAYQCEDYDESQAGRDLYFTYSGSGVGYWSREQLSQSSNPEKTKDLQEIMRAPGTTPDQLNALFAQVKSLESDIGQKLTAACGCGEINLDAYKSKKHPSGFLVSFYIG